MKTKRLKKPMSFYLNTNLMERLDKWMASKELPPSKTSFVELAIKEALDRRKAA